MGHDNLWAPWRVDYLEQLAQREASSASDDHGCFLCRAVAADPDRDSELLVLHREDAGVLMLNRYPYTNGHLLAAPSQHVADLTDLTAAKRAALMELAARGARLLRDAVNPQGMNVGMNIGRCAGAGLPGHLHLHIVPRWSGDVNFMDVGAQVRVIPQALQRSYEMLRDAAARLRDDPGSPR